MNSLRTREGRIKYLCERNAMLEKLRSSVEELDYIRVQECTKSAIDGYKKATNIRYMARVIKERDIEAYRFRSIALYHLIDKDKFLAKDYYWGQYFADVGRAVARGEEKYIHRKISSVSTGLDKVIFYHNPNFTMINEGIRILKEKSFNPNVVLLPIELYVSFYKYYKDKMEWSIDGHTRLFIEDCSLSVFWSNKYAPLRSVMIFDSNSSIWRVLVNQTTNNNILFAIGVSEQSRDKVAYIIETLAYYSVNKEAFIKIKLSK